MKLYNKTKCPDKILEPLLATAGKSIGARTSKVIVKVTQGQHHYSSGKATQIPLVYTWHLKSLKCRRKNPEHLGSLISTDGGYIKLILPAQATSDRLDLFGGSIAIAQRFYKIAQHEWVHIKDFQQHTHYKEPRTPSGRRIDHDSRPCELSARQAVRTAKKLNIDDMILNLAIYFESKNP